MSHSTKAAFSTGSFFVLFLNALPRQEGGDEVGPQLADELPGFAVVGGRRPGEGRLPFAAEAREGRQVSRFVPDM